MIGYVVLGQYNFSKYHTIYLQSSGCQASLDAQPSVNANILAWQLRAENQTVPHSFSTLLWYLVSSIVESVRICTMLQPAFINSMPN